MRPGGQSDQPDRKPPPRVAHAGGGYKGRTYTNSLEALEANAGSYTAFEIDFVWTSDDELVCLHDWKDTAVQIFGRSFDPPLTLAEFSELASENDGLTPCTAHTLFKWLDEHPGTKVVTDVKADNVRALAYIASRYAEFHNRIIPQIYEPSEYGPVKQLGYEDIIWTLYAHAGSDDEVVAVAPTMPLYAVAMPIERAERGLGSRLAAKGLVTYVHTVNEPAQAEDFKRVGISEIYTDWLAAAF